MSTKSQGARVMSEATQALLQLLAEGGQWTVRKLFEHLNPDTKVIPQLFRNRLSYLKRTGCIEGSSKDSYKLTPKGLNRLVSLQFVMLQPQEKWDGLWRVIAFDIPESNRLARDVIRKLIKQLGCYQLQRSVWIHPFPCLEEFRQIQAAYGIKGNLLLLEVANFDQEKQLLKIFRTQYPSL